MRAFALCILLTAYTAIAASIVVARSSQDAPKRRPNVVLILGDDHGWADIGALGINADVATPNLDDLVEDPGEATNLAAEKPELVEHLLDTFRVWRGE